MFPAAEETSVVFSGCWVKEKKNLEIKIQTASEQLPVCQQDYSKTTKQISPKTRTDPF